MSVNTAIAETQNKAAEAVVNIDELPDISRREVHMSVAKRIAEDTLEYVNANSKPVTPRNSFYSKFGKRALDIIISAVALIVLAPVNLILAICTFFDVGRPIIFSQRRTGKDGKLFTIVKFRNMTNEKDANGDLLPPSKRVTRFGRFVRKTSLDELLNFWSIFKGDMSIIGPRPLDPVYMDRYSERHKQRHAVRPGLECPMLHRPDHQISWSEQFENDVFYVENVSFLLDLKLIFALVRMVFDKRSRKIRGDAMRGAFMGYDREANSITSKTIPIGYVGDLIDENIMKDGAYQ